MSSSCGGSWSAIAAAGPQSTLSGVLAGFVFTGIVAVLSTSPPSDAPQDVQRKRRSYALQLLIAAFIIFAIDSYFSSIIAGEESCIRANAESGLSGGVLGTAAVLLLAGLAWLLVTYSSVKEVKQVLACVMMSVWLIVIVMLAVSGMGVGQGMLQHRWQGFVDWAPWIISIVMAGLVVLVALRSTRLNEEHMAASVIYASLTGLVAAMIAALFAGIAGAMSAAWWSHASAGLVYTIVILSVFIPAAALTVSVPAAMGALTRPAPMSETDEGGSERLEATA